MAASLCSLILVKHANSRLYRHARATGSLTHMPCCAVEGNPLLYPAAALTYICTHLLVWTIGRFLFQILKFVVLNSDMT